MTDPVFTHDALRAAAEHQAGHDDYGSDGYPAGLRPLLHSIAHEAQLHVRGRQEMWRRIVAALANRLTLAAWEKANPVAAAAPIRPPLVMLGLGRTGSSILHETLAVAPGRRTPMTWELRDFSLVHRVTDARAKMPSVQTSHRDTPRNDPTLRARCLFGRDHATRRGTPGNLLWMGGRDRRHARCVRCLRLRCGRCWR